MESPLEKNTPLMQQYFTIKAQHPDTLLLFQVGDFFELFFDDAKTAAGYLAIALTKRGKNKGEDIPLCGIPVHALNHYLTKLIKGGYRVALCEQLTKPQPGTVVERGVTRVFTPATLTDAAMLDDKSASYLLAFVPGERKWGLLFGELLTAQLFATTIPAEATRQIESELIRFSPDEVILPTTKQALGFDGYFKKLGYSTSIAHPIDTASGPAIPTAWMSQRLCAKTQAMLGAHPVLVDNVQTLYWYLKRNHERALEQFKTIHLYQPDDYLILDAATQQNLELVKNSHDGSTKHTLFAILDHARTAMGSRTIKKWIGRPLVQPSAIVQRHEVVSTLATNVTTLQQTEQLLSSLGDVERMVGRIALRRALVNDYLALKSSLAIVPSIKQLLLKNIQTPLAQLLGNRIADLSPLHDLLTCSINDDGDSTNPIKPGFDSELDSLRHLLANGQQEVLKLEQQEIARTGINSLKIGFTNISGYYIEVTNPNLDKVPDDYQHQQTLVNRKRFVTQALKDLERALTKAQNELDAVQNAAYERVKTAVEEYLTPLRHVAQSLATLDALFGFATAAYEYRYCQPVFNDHHTITITEGRHPIVEQTVSQTFTPNDTTLTNAAPTWIITGPNMGGKSTYLRQVAIMSIMAQCGSFVPAAQANLPVLDRIFTRIGSGDNLAEGKSTFLVEMEEAATICTQATKHSLVILDEVGRGTSTYDGIALAQAILEYIHTHIGARCLFATHYHELTSLAHTLSGIINYHAASKRVNNAIVFLHKIIPGVAEGSFGLEVAKLAGLPVSITQRAGEILATLGKPYTAIHPEPAEEFAALTHTNACNHAQEITELKNMLQQQQIFLDQLNNIDYNNLSPKQAFDLLWNLKQLFL